MAASAPFIRALVVPNQAPQLRLVNGKAKHLAPSSGLDTTKLCCERALTWILVVPSQPPRLRLLQWESIRKSSAPKLNIQVQAEHMFGGVLRLQSAAAIDCSFLLRHACP